MGGGRASSIHVFITARVFYLRVPREREEKGILFFKNNALLHRSSPAILFRLSFTLPAVRVVACSTHRSRNRFLIGRP